jgi:hypothetical protein
MKREDLSSFKKMGKWRSTAAELRKSRERMIQEVLGVTLLHSSIHGYYVAGSKTRAHGTHNLDL